MSSALTVASGWNVQTTWREPTQTASMFAEVLATAMRRQVHRVTRDEQRLSAASYKGCGRLLATAPYL